MQPRVDIVCSTSMLCNLRCRYCDVLPLLNDPTRMTLEQIERMFVHVEAYYRRSGAVHVNFQWYGGEPLLIPPVEYRKIFELQKRIFHGSGHRVTNALQSNFTMLDDERIDLLLEHFDVVGASLDLFTRLRVNAAGVCQEERAQQNLERALAAGIEVSGITVLSRHNVSRVDEIYRFYRKRRMRFRLLPLERGLYRPGQDFEVTPRETLAALARLVDLWLSDDDPVPVEPLGRYLFLVRHLIVRPNVQVKIYDRERWPSILLVSTDGSVRGYGDRFQESLGNVCSEPLETILGGAAFRSSCAAGRARMERTCTSCAYFGRPCPGDPIAESQQDFIEVDPHGQPICVVARGLFAHLEERITNAPRWVFGPIGDTMVREFAGASESSS